jgi:hypothetical protein
MEVLLKLIEEYKEITLELLKSLFNDENTRGDDVMNLITGFGNINTCSICKDAKQRSIGDRLYDCEFCIYRKLFSESESDKLYCLDESYDNIAKAESAEELYHAIQERIQVLEQAIKDYENIRVYKR